MPWTKLENDGEGIMVMCVCFANEGWSSPYRFKGRSQWPCGLRFSSAVARLLRLQVQIPPGACCECYLKITVTTYGYATLPKYNRISQLTTRYQSLISHRKKAGVCFTLTFCTMWSGLIPSSATEKKTKFICFCLIKYYSINSRRKIISYTISRALAAMQWTGLSGTHNHTSNPPITAQTLRNVRTSVVNGRGQIFCPELHKRKAQ